MNEEAGLLEEAISLYEETLADCERVLGPGHQLTRNVRFDLGDAQQTAGEQH